MGDKSKIEWTDASWNPIRSREARNGKIGWHCEHVSEGCRHCYAERMNKGRFGNGLEYKPALTEDRHGHGPWAQLFLDDKMLTRPLRWRRPRMIFVCSMTDLFADFVPDMWIDKMFAVMALCPQHTFQVLTKRPQRMRDYFTAHRRPATADDLRRASMFSATNRLQGYIADYVKRGAFEPNGYGPIYHQDWERAKDRLRHHPLANVWLGVSIEDQAAANERLPHLLQTPAAIRFASAEPLLGPIDLTAIRYRDGDAEMRWNALTAEAWVDNSDSASAYADYCDGVTKLDWLIAGGESGPKARPMHPDWPLALRDQCKAASVPFFFKQWGEWAASGAFMLETMIEGTEITHPKYDVVKVSNHPLDGRTYMFRVGKKAAGALLDGIEHRAFPEAHAKAEG
jgi:protein gp37